MLSVIFRIDIGGKVLTNHLKEVISYRSAYCLLFLLGIEDVLLYSCYYSVVVLIYFILTALYYYLLYLFRLHLYVVIPYK